MQYFSNQGPGLLRSDTKWEVKRKYSSRGTDRDKKFIRVEFDFLPSSHRQFHPRSSINIVFSYLTESVSEGKVEEWKNGNTDVFLRRHYRRYRRRVDT